LNCVYTFNVKTFIEGEMKAESFNCAQPILATKVCSPRTMKTSYFLIQLAFTARIAAFAAKTSHPTSA
jgi:hypothetical protein